MNAPPRSQNNTSSLPSTSSRSILVSIITPTKNRATSFLPDVLKSVSCQSLPVGMRIEHIVADDGSAPTERDTLRALTRGMPHLKIIYREESGGVSAARNSAFRAAQGELIIDLDDDDVLPSTSVRDRVSHLLRTDNFWSFGDMLKVDESLRYKLGHDLFTRITPPATIMQAMHGFLSGSLYAWAGTRTYRREAIELAGPWDESFRVAEDLEHWMRLTALASEPAICECYLVLFREKERSLGIDALNDGSMDKYALRARQRWANYFPGGPLPAGLPQW